LSGNIVVVKIGGSTLGQSDTSLADLVSLQKRSERVIVVHGGGGEVSQWSSRLGLESRFVDGLRVTGKDELGVVVAVLAGLVNKRLVLQLNALGGRAVGIAGVDAGLIAAEVRQPELGYVGEVTHVDMHLLFTLLDARFLPVVAPVCHGVHEGRQTFLNVNADDVAAELAIAAGASSLVFLTDVPGILDGRKQVFSRLTVSAVHQLMADGVVQGGMLPKARACVTASRSVAEARIIDGTAEHALLREFDHRTGGTSIVRDELA
jgi:acetylglutamate kinase